MEALFYYVLKSGGLLTLFYGGYQLFLRKETIFHFSRLFLLSGLVLSFVLPCIELTKTVTISLTAADSLKEVIPHSIINPSRPFLNIYTLVCGIYMLGAVVQILRLGKQGAILNTIFRKGTHTRKHKTVHVISNAKIQPSSFFNFIIYNPHLHSDKELKAILAHEEVHANQLHSIDIILMELVIALQWFNPVVWFYQSALKQNLEFLADTENQEIKIDKKGYQYTLLRHSIYKQELSIINPFFNSLIKKRIVMINQKKSHPSAALKALLILPLLIFFLVSFNTKEVYSLANEETLKIPDTVIELIIDKNTTDEQLLKMKADLGKEKFDLSYTIVRNETGEIMNLLLEVSGGNKTIGEVSSRFTSTSDNDTIDPTYVFIDTESNTISIGKSELVATKSNDHTTVWIQKSDSESGEHIMVKRGNGTEEIIINSVKATDNELKEIGLDVKDATVIVLENDDTNGKDIKIKSATNKNVFISTSPSSEHDIKILEEEGNGFIFLTTTDGKEPLVYIDGEKSDSKFLKSLDPNQIASMNVLKGTAAVKKYGKKAKDGVIEITTKK